MAITVIQRGDWKLVPPEQRGAGAGAKLLGQSVLREDPCLFILEEPPNYYTSAHSHTEQEVIVVLEGRMMFNGQWVEQGTVVHVPANEDYWHATGAERCVVALMRPTKKGNIRYAREATAE